MIKNLFLVAVRLLFRQKTNTIIKAGGLAVAFTCCLLIILYVRFESSYDSFHRQADHIFRIVEDVTLPSGKTGLASARGPVGPALVREFPELTTYTRLNGASMLFKYGENHFQEDNIYFADPTVFEVFTFPFLKGDPQTALTKPNSIVFTKTAAGRYFGGGDPMYKEIIVDNEVRFTVTGVIDDIPANSHLSFDILLSMSTRGDQFLNSWIWSAYTYVVAEGTTPEAVQQRLSHFASAHQSQLLSAGESERVLLAQPLKDIHLYSKRAGEPGTPGNASNLLLFSIIAALVLLIACVNFVNLTTAETAGRAREVGIRKVIGGTRAQLVNQFLMESVLLSMAAGIFAFGAASLLLPFLHGMTGIVISANLLHLPGTLALCLVVPVAVGCVAGWYPAFVLSGFRPATALKGSLKASQPGVLRQGLIVIQFSISIALAVGTITVFTQLNFMQNKDLGYDKEQVLVIYFGDDSDVQAKTETIKQEFLRSPHLSGSAASSNVPGRDPGRARVEMTSAAGDMKTLDAGLFAVDHDFISFFNLAVVAGHSFSPGISSDSEGLMVNESALGQLGFERADDILGREMTVRGVKGKVIGVVKDFHYASLHRPIEPMVMRMRSKSLSYISLKIESGATSIIPALERQWKQLAPTRPFDYFFLDQQFDRLYRADRRFGQLFGTAALISIILACLGLFGLVSFIVQQRTKEIGIRKVLGASVAGIVALLSTNFMKLVGVAIIIATAGSWYVMTLWLRGFAYRVEMQWWMFVLAGGMGTIVALVTISLKSVKAAMANPADVLRKE